MRIFFFAGNLLNPIGLVAKGPLSLLSLVCDLTTYPPSMPYNSWTEAENELMEMSTYDTAIRALRSTQGSSPIFRISIISTHVLQI